MKIRTDFVTNSSSSSFILSRKGELNEAQKKAIIDYVEKEMIGEVMLTPENTEEEIQNVFEEEEYLSEEAQADIRKALKEGRTIYRGWAYFDGWGKDYSDILEDIWKILESNGNGNFKAIDDDLSY